MWLMYLVAGLRNYPRIKILEYLQSADPMVKINPYVPANQQAVMALGLHFHALQ